MSLALERPSSVAQLLVLVALTLVTLLSGAARAQDVVIGVNVVNPMRASIADQNAGSLFPDGGRFTLGSDGFDDATYVCRYGQPVLRTERNGGHAFVLTAAVNDGENQFAILIAERNL